METPKIQFRQCHKSNYRAGRAGKVRYIVIHYSANNGDKASGNAGYFARTANLKASANYFVDENEIWQSVKDGDTAWHCGAEVGYKHPYCRNGNSIGIELCSEKDAKGNYYFTPETVARGVELTKYLMEKYSVPIGNVIRHYDVTGKNCPAPFVQDNSQWVAFKKRLESDIVPDWMKKIMDDAKAIGLITGEHDPQEKVSKWFVLAAGLNVIKIIKGGK